MHAQAEQWVKQYSSHVPPGGKVLEIGARDINGSIRGLFPDQSWTGLDAAAGPGVDIVADAADFDGNAEFDAVVCTEVLEHAERAGMIVFAAYLALKPGGVLILTCAGPDRKPHGADGSPKPADGEWYQNVSAGELTEWLEAAGFATFKIDEREKPSDVRCVAWRGE
jgi:SAM-dependent methyltransferase